jgi:hypothetical protein
MRRIAASWTIGVVLAAGVVSAQPPSVTDVASRVHREGGYPDDITVIDDDDDSHGDGAEGAGDGPHGAIGLHGDRDGGDANPSLDIPIPDFVRDLIAALGRLLGTAAVPIGYVLLAVGIALVIALIVYLIVMMRIPKRDLLAGRRRDASAEAPTLDPLLAESNASAEEHAAAGRYREAIHALFLRALREATSAGDVDRRGRTAREVVALVERMHGAIAPLAELLALTELVWFGGRAATEEQYLAARELAANVTTSTRSLAVPLGASA